MNPCKVSEERKRGSGDEVIEQILQSIPLDDYPNLREAAIELVSMGYDHSAEFESGLDLSIGNVGASRVDDLTLVDFWCGGPLVRATGLKLTSSTCPAGVVIPLRAGFWPLMMLARVGEQIGLAV